MSSAKWRPFYLGLNVLTKERSHGEALIQWPLASPLYEAGTHVK